MMKTKKNNKQNTISLIIGLVKYYKVKIELKKLLS